MGGKKTRSVQLISLPSVNSKGGWFIVSQALMEEKRPPPHPSCVAYDPDGVEGQVMHSPDSDYRVLCQPFRKEWA